MAISEHIEEKLALLPNEPGSYQMKDKNGKIIYVGKAKNLKNRVRSYFKQQHSGKTAELVENIVDFDYIVTNSDKEAFLLENTLIKKYKPYYNIKLKYGTGYPYIKITHEKDPKLELVSDIKKDLADYFGPYPNVYAAQETLHFLQKIYPLRRCSGYQGRPCLYYHLRQCLGACFQEVDQKKYQANILEIKKFLNGDTKELKQYLKDKMAEAAQKMEFERAAEYRDQIKFIDETVESQRVISNDTMPRDLFNFYVDKGWMSVEIFFLRQSKLMRQDKFIVSLIGDPNDEMMNVIQQYYLGKNIKLPKEILVPDGLDNDLLTDVLDVQVKTPKRGEKFELLKLAEKNAKIALEEKMRLLLLNEEKTIGACQQLSDCLEIDFAHRIEAFDHSHEQGTDLVSAMVSFVDGKAFKKGYRKYKIKTVQQADEFATTKEVIFRRYSRLIKEKQELPDLILIDGGEIQLKATKEVIEQLGLQIPIAAMVKNEKHKTAELLSEDGEIVQLDKKSEAFYLLQRIQEEVHRFAISFHKQLHSKTSMTSILDQITGVGPKTRQKLLKEYGSLAKIKLADVDDIVAKTKISKKTANMIKMSLNARDEKK